MPRSVIVITDGSLKLADSQAGLTTGTAFECQVIEAAVNATPNMQTVPATWCAGESQSAGATGWELAVTWLQDWRSPTGGLSGYAYTNDAQAKWFELKLDKDDTTPVATGQAYVVAGAFGGAAGVPAQASATWPCLAKPSVTLPSAVLLREGEELEESEEAEESEAVAV